MKQRFDFKPLLFLFGFMIVGMMLAVSAQQNFFSSASPDSQPVQFLIISAVFLIFSFGLPSWIWLLMNRTLMAETSTHSIKVKQYGIAVLLFVAIMIVGNYIIDWITRLLTYTSWSNLANEADNISAVRDLLSHKNLMPLILLVIAVVPAVVEEYFFRRIIFSYLYNSNKSFWISAILSSLIFAGMHNHLVSFFSIFLMGMALSFAYFTTKSIWLSVALHALNNSIAILILYLELDNEANVHWTIVLIAACFAVFVVKKYLNPSNP